MTDDRASGWYLVIADDGVVRMACYDADQDKWTVEEEHSHLWNGTLIVVGGPFERPAWMLPPIRRRH